MLGGPTQPTQSAGLGVTDILAIVGFALSLGLAAIKTWETFFRKSRFEADIVWADPAGDAHVEIAIANVGWKKDTVRSVWFRAPHPDREHTDLAWLLWEVGGDLWPQLPIVLDVDEVTPRFVLPLRVLQPIGMGKLESELIAGTAQLVVLNARRGESVFSVPAPGTGPPPPTPDQVRG